jgi:hypothetical protein
MKAGAFLVTLLSAPVAEAKGEQPVAVPHDFTEGYDRVTIGDEAQAQVGEWTLENAGALIAWRRIQLVRGKTLPDARLRRRVAERLREGFPGQRIDVKVSHGIVSLRGRARSREAAGMLLWTAMRTPGVEEVRSFVSWPTVMGR